MSDIPEGYKQTEVGVIPEDWEVKELGELGSFSKGKGIRKDEVVSEGLPCIRYGEIYTTHNDYIKSFKSFITQSIANESIEIENGDLLFAGSGETAEEIGKCVAFVGNERVFAGGDIVILRPSINANSLFLGFFLNHPIVSRQKARMGQGDAVVHISGKNLSEIQISLPPLPEQQAIASALTDVDALITALEQLIAKKRNIKQGAMQQLLTGEKRLPGFGGKWEVKSFGETFKFLQTGNNSRSDLSEYGEIKNIHYGDIHTKWKSFLDCSKDIIPSIDKDKVKNLPLLEEGDLVMADASEDYNGLGVSVEVKNIKNEKVVAGLHTLLLRGDKTIVADGFKGYIQSIKTVQDSLKRISTGISVYSISKNNLKSILIPLPSLPEQQAIAQILTDMDAEIEALEQKQAKYKAIKQGMMQELLTGKTRLV